MNLYLIELVRYLAAQSWQIAVLTMAVAVVTFALRHRSAHVRYLLWLMVVAKCLVPPLHVTPLRVLPPVLERTPSSSLPSARSPDPSPVPNPILPDTLKALHDAVSFPVDRGIDSRPSASITVLLSPLGRAAAILWLIGASSYLAMNLLRALRGHYWLRRRRKPLPNGIQAGTTDLLGAYDARRLPRVYLVDGVSQPFVWGLIRGSIYVPPGFLSLESPEHRRDILAHELSHVLRFDAAVNALQIVAQSLFWFHPFVWWANSTIRREREKCCDEMVIARLHTTPKDYSTAIVEILARIKESGRSVPSLAVASPLKHIEGRIRTILRPGKRFHARPSLPVVTLVILAALAAVPTTLVVTALAVEPIALARPLGGFPRTLNGWTGEELEIPTTIQEYMRANFADDFLNRRYTNKASQQWADLYMVYCSSRPGAILSHRPEVSFPANGWIHDGTKTSQITSHSGRSIDCLIHRFHKPSPQPTEVTVLCFYLVNGRISVNEQDFSHPSARRLNVSGNPAQYVAQVELSSTVEDSVRSAASALADAILDSLPDPNGRIFTSQSAEAHLQQEANKQPATAGMNESNALPSPLAEFPRTLNGWTGEDLEIHTTVQKYMRANFADDFISRRYTNEATRQWADLYVVGCLSRPREILRHRPLLCYPGNGWIWDQTVPSHIMTSSNRIFLCVTHRFHRPPTQQLAVLCFYVVDNKIMSDQDLSLRLARETDPPRYVAQVQISSVQEDAVHSAANAMADALVKTLAIRGPSVSIINGAEERPGAQDTNDERESRQPGLRARTFNSKMAFDVFVKETLSGIPDIDPGEMEAEPRWIGRTPSTVPLGIPAGWIWWVLPSVPIQDWDLLIRELDRNGIPGLKLPLATDSDMEHLAGLSELKYLDLMSPQITDAGMAHLKGLTQLEWLNLPGAAVTDAGLAYLEGMTKLQIIDLSHTQITDAGMTHLNGLIGLQCLSLQDNPITDAGLEELKGLTELQFLDLLGTRITDAGLAHLTNLAELQALLLGSSKITGPGLAYLKSMPRLRGLVLAGTQVTDASLAHLASLTGLQGLTLSGSQITDAGIAHVKGLTGLRILELENTQITDAGLAHLEGLTRLQWLDLTSDRITDSGLEQIKNLTTLHHLNIRGAQITVVGLRQFRQSFPNLATD